VRVDERAEREDREAATAGVVEGFADQRRADALALEGVIDLSVNEGDQPRPRSIVRESGRLPIHPGLVAVLLGIVANVERNGTMLRPHFGPGKSVSKPSR
jgi:hypothetical protein